MWHIGILTDDYGNTAILRSWDQCIDVCLLITTNPVCCILLDVIDTPGMAELPNVSDCVQRNPVIGNRYSDVTYTSFRQRRSSYQVTGT